MVILINHTSTFIHAWVIQVCQVILKIIVASSMFFVHTLPPGLASSGPHPPGPDGLATGWLVWWKNMVYLLYQMVTLVACYYKRSINMWVVVTFQGTICPGIIYLGHIPWS